MSDWWVTVLAFGLLGVILVGGRIAILGIGAGARLERARVAKMAGGEFGRRCPTCGRPL